MCLWGYFYFMLARLPPKLKISSSQLNPRTGCYTTWSRREVLVGSCSTTTKASANWRLWGRHWTPSWRTTWTTWWSTRRRNSSSNSANRMSRSCSTSFWRLSLRLMSWKRSMTCYAACEKLMWKSDPIRGEVRIPNAPFMFGGVGLHMGQPRMWQRAKRNT